MDDSTAYYAAWATAMLVAPRNRDCEYFAESGLLSDRMGHMSSRSNDSDRLFWEKVEAARRLTAGEKLFAGLDLFREVKQRMRAGIRHQFPEMTDDEVEIELNRRLAINRKLENRPRR